MKHWLRNILILTLWLGNTLEDDITASKDEEFSSEGRSPTLSCNYSVKADNLQWYRQDPGSAPQFLLLITDTTKPSVVEANPPHPRLTADLNAERNRVDLQISSAEVTDSAVYYCAVMLDLLFEKVFLDTGPYVDEVLKIPIPEGLTVQFARPGKQEVVTTRLTDMNNPHFAALGSMNSINPESTEEHVSEGGNINLTCKYNGSIYNIQWYRQYQRSRPEFLLYITEGRLIHPNDSDFSADINKSEKRVHLKIISAKVTDSAVYYCAVKPTVTGNTKTLYKNLWSKDNRILHNIH
ncbi:hypothetical protein GBF38_015842 [Nibea albiflora]|uniref:Uncharacterized protein n=1 Tax=Nibea albiflora TaxID=240163 RepID=A0ACB7FIQ9_NIBAL|nr:hypothetical protein GBF38_015842 [Nibea albiflora]